MKRIGMMAVAGFACLAGGALVSAQEQQAQLAPQTRVYVIQQGDTLWDLSASFLNSPWYWPRIWHVNPQITNPHRIYPGQELTLPGAYAGEAVAEAAPAEAAPQVTAPAQTAAAATAPAEQQFAEAPEAVEPAIEEEQAPEISPDDTDMLAVEEQLPALPTETQLQSAVIRRAPEKRFYVKKGDAGFISKERTKAAATVVGAHTEKLLYTQHDKVFISLGEGSGVEVGQLFTAYRPVEDVHHPVSNKLVGYRTKQLGILRVTEVHEDVATAYITDAYDAIDKGSLLVPFEPYEKRIFPQPSPEEMAGVVLIGDEGSSYNGEHSIIYIDRGADNNLSIGQVIEFIRPMPNERDDLTKKSVRIPPKLLGAGIVVDTQPTTSTVLIWDSKDYVTRGDVVRPLAAR
jgi:LysM repeat protein